MDTATKAWLISQVGSAASLDDLAARYARLGSARAVALEFLNQQLADLRADIASIAVSGVVSLNTAENIKAYERKIALLEGGASPAPDEPADTDDDDETFGVIYFTGRERR